MSSSARLRITSVLILLLGVIAGFFAAADRLGIGDAPILQRLIRPYRLGLDLVGGTHLLYRADVSGLGGTPVSEAMAGLRDAIERRVNLFGVTDPLIQVETAGEEHRLIVELAGVRDIGEAIRIIGQTPKLDFRELAIPAEEAEAESADPRFVPAGLDGRYLKRAELGFDATTRAPLINVEFTDEGARRFEEITARNVGKPLGIYLDDQLRSAPVVQEAIAGGKAQVTGQFTIEEARSLVRDVNFGALPVPISLASQQSVGAALGAESLSASLSAALIGFLAVTVFMAAWYRLPGLVAVVALLIYAALVLALFKLIPVTLTAAGIAGFVLSVGMAVDANVLIFERMKEELAQGSMIADAVRGGFARAWTSIRDSNVSSLITAAILYWLGTSVVKGFALTLGIGVIVSMFSAISVSRTLLLVMVTPGLARYRTLFLSGFGKRTGIT